MYRKILLPIDDVATAGVAIANAKEIAKSMNAEVILFHVVTPDNPLVLHDEHLGGVHAAAGVVEQAQVDEARHVAGQEAVLEEAAAGIQSDGVNIVTEVAVGNAHEEIARVVRDEDIDLVIISTHGRRGVSRAFLGSVADEVIHDVGVPVMVVSRSV